MQIVSVLVLYCLVVFWTDCTSVFLFFILMNCSFIQNRRLLLLFFMVVSALQSLLFLNGTFMDELLVVGFKLGVPRRSRHDMVKKEKMDWIFKEKCCIAISLWLLDQQIWWHPQECTKSTRKIWFMHLRSWTRTRIPI